MSSPIRLSCCLLKAMRNESPAAQCRFQQPESHASRIGRRHDARKWLGRLGRVRDAIQVFLATANAHSEEVPWRGHAEAVNRFILDLTRRELMVLGAPFRFGRSRPPSSSWRSVHVVCANHAGGTIAHYGTCRVVPLHNPPSLDALGAAEIRCPKCRRWPSSTRHFTLHCPLRRSPTPCRPSWTRDWGIRRFGFHGLSHAYCSRRAAEMLDRPADQLRLVICHLGHGCSATAVHRGQSIDTTMGFTPLEGLMMGTRSGSIDPGIVLHVQQQHGLTSEQIETTLNTKSGLLGVSEIAADMRQVLAAAHDGHEPSRLGCGNLFAPCAASHRCPGGDARRSRRAGIHGRCR